MCLLSMCTHSFLFSLTLCASIPFSRLLELWSRMMMKGRPNSSNASAGVPLIVAIRALGSCSHVEDHVRISPTARALSSRTSCSEMVKSTLQYPR